MGEIAFLDGKYLPIAEAKVSVNDRGFLFGDGVYEVVRTYAGRLWALEPHLERLARSMKAIELPGPGPDIIRARVTEAHRRSELPDAQVYVEITRGAAPRSHAFPAEARPTFLITVRAGGGPTGEERQRGVRIITVPDIRWGRCDIKSVNLLPNILAKQQAKTAGAYEAVFVRADGQVTEGSSTSLFAVRNGRLLTREEGAHILSGITRRIVLEIARDMKIRADEGPLSLDEVLRADEVFLTGTNTEVMPVVAVRDSIVGGGRPGPMARSLQEEYRKRIASP
jgi:D-alanine transaminase